MSFFIRGDVCLSGNDLLQVDLEQFRGLGQLDRSYLMWQASHDLRARPEVVANYFDLVWAGLKVPKRGMVTDRAWKELTSSWISFQVVSGIVAWIPILCSFG